MQSITPNAFEFIQNDQIRSNPHKYGHISNIFRRNKQKKANGKKPAQIVKEMSMRVCVRMCLCIICKTRVECMCQTKSIIWRSFDFPFLKQQSKTTKFRTKNYNLVKQSLHTTEYKKREKKLKFCCLFFSHTKSRRTKEEEEEKKNWYRNKLQKWVLCLSVWPVQPSQVS